MTLFLLLGIPLTLLFAAALYHGEAHEPFHTAFVFVMGLCFAFPLYLVYLLFHGSAAMEWSPAALYRWFFMKDYLFFFILGGLGWYFIYGRGGKKRFSTNKQLEAMAWMAGIFTLLSLGEFFVLNSTATVYQLFYLPLFRIAGMLGGGVMLFRGRADRGRSGLLALGGFLLVTLFYPLVPVLLTMNRDLLAFMLFLLLFGGNLAYAYIFAVKSGAKKLSQISFFPRV